MFDFKLYKEGLRRSTLISALFIAVMMLGAILIPVANITSQMRATSYGWALGRTVIEGLDTNIILLLSAAALSPVLTLYLFSFLNKRNSSDFYHSIPHKRETLFASFAAAVLTWVLGGIWLCTGLSLLIYSFFPAYVMLNMTSILLATLGLSAACILVVGATLIAMSLTGGTFANIVTALLIIFLPRVILTTFTSIVMQMTRIVPVENFGIIGDGSFNIPFGFMFNMFNGGMDLNQVFIRGALYTAVLGLIYLGIAIVLFKKRRSETAQNPAPNRGMQSAIRVTVAFVVCLPALAIIAMGLRFERGSQRLGSDILPLVAIYAIAVIVYLAYELITTKKLSNIAKALPGLGILVLLNVVFLSGIMISRSVILNRRFEPNQIASVRVLLFDDTWRGGSDWISWVPYETIRTREVEIQDEDAITILLETLDRNIEWARGEPFWGSPYSGMILFETTGGRSVQRSLMFTEAVGQEFSQILAGIDEYAEALLTLPENPGEIHSHNLPEEAAREIFEILREEVAGLDSTAWRPGQNLPLPTYGTLFVQGFIYGQTYRSFYEITSTTPLTADVFIRHTNAQNYENVIRALEHMLAEGLLGSISIHGYNTPYPVSFHRWERTRGEDLVNLLLDAVREQGQNPVDRERRHYNITVFGWWDELDGWHPGGEFFFNSDCEELFEALR